MAVTFVIGRAGSGKTRRCFNAIAGAMRADPLAGPPIYWVVPKQATFMAERELTCAAGLAGFCRARVVSFESLGREIFAYAGGSAVPEVTPLGRQMILGHLLRQHQPRLHFFKSSARQPGLAAELDATFAEFERSGQSVDDLSLLVADMESARPADVDGVALLAKLRDVRLLYEAYTTFLGQDRLDPHRRLDAVLAAVAECPPLRGATVYVDGFLDFSAHERRVLAAVAKVCAHIEVTVLCDPASPTVADPNTFPDESSQFYRTATAYQRLWFAFNEEGVGITEPVLLTDQHRFCNPVLVQVERDLFADATPSRLHSGERAGVRGQTAERLKKEERRMKGRETSPDLGSSFILPPSSMPTQALTPTLSPAYRGEGEMVTLIVAPDRRAEVESAARHVRRLLCDGLRLRDIVLLVRDLDAYQVLIDTTFREHGIAYFVDRRRTATHHPLLWFVRCAFQVARHGWPHDAVIALLKTGLVGLSLDEADAVENYVLLHRIRGSEGWEAPGPWAYQRRLTLRRDDEEGIGAEERAVTTIDALRRRVTDGLKPLLRRARAGREAAVRDWAADLFATFDRLGVREVVERWARDAEAAGCLEESAEHGQVWAEFVELIDQMVELLGDERMDAAAFVDVLESGLERFDLAITPPTVDQVLVGQVDRTRTPADCRAALLPGMNDGEFPRAFRDETILADHERRELRRRRVELDPDAERRRLDERLLGYLAFTRAAERLYVSRPLDDGSGQEAQPSPFWNDLRALLPDVEPIEVPAERRDDPRYIDTPRQLVASLMHWVREGPSTHASVPPLPPGEGRGEGEGQYAHGSANTGESTAFNVRPHPNPLPGGEGTIHGPWPALYHWLATRDARGDGVDALRSLAWPSLRYSNDARLSPEIAGQLFPTPLQASAGQLETFAACPFRHFLRHGLRLQGREEQGVTALDLSQVYHQVLDIVVAEALESRTDLRELAKAVTPEQLHDYAQAIGQQLRGELMLSTARNRYLLDRIERTLGDVLANQAEAMRRGQFRPAFTDVAFGEHGKLPALRVKTPTGADVVLRGKIDRVDLLPAGEHAAVFDYRLGSRTLSLGEAFHGLSLQLLTHLLVLQANGEELAGKPLTPAAAFYLQVSRRLGDVDHPGEALDPANPRFHLRVKPRGVFDGTFLPAFDADIGEDGRSDVVHARVKKDGTFGYRNQSDVADANEFAGLLAFVRRRLGELADGVLAGIVEVRPYRINRDTPCPRCECRSVCRFDPSINTYRHLPPMRREDVLKVVTEGGQGDGA